MKALFILNDPPYGSERAHSMRRSASLWLAVIERFRMPPPNQPGKCCVRPDRPGKRPAAKGLDRRPVPRRPRAALAEPAHASAKRTVVSLRRLVEQPGQPGDGGCDCSRFIFSHEMARVSNLRREVDICHSETVGVANDVREAAIFLECPGRREAAGLLGRIGHGPSIAAQSA